jgi:8-oxo-dGTP pyrophosphatase MutT (NUDIX family)
MEAIVVLIIYNDGEALVVKREQRGDEVSPWVFPAGVTEDNPVADAEEIAQYLLGARGADAEVLEQTEHGSDTNVSYVALKASPPLNPEDEIEEYTWMSHDELRHLAVDVDPVVLDFLQRKE